MRPIALRFNGINSYSVEQNVNFELLTKHQVFGIVGKTGSGKTTILDCIILALYGKVPRDDSSNPKNFVNTDVTECFVEFKFSAINNKILKTYIVTRAFKLGKDNQLKLSKCNLVEIVQEQETVICSDKVKELNQVIEDVVGLKYEYFTKAVILPQGKFSEFLTLKNKDKGEMLEQIFSLEKYGDTLSFKFNSEKSKTKNRIETINSNIEAIGVNDNVAELEKNIKDQKELKEKSSAEHKKLIEHLVKDREILKLLNDLDENKEFEKKILNEKESIELLEKNIDKYINANKLYEKIEGNNKLKNEVDVLKETEKKLIIDIKNNSEEIEVFGKKEQEFNKNKAENFEKIIADLSKVEQLQAEKKTIADDEKEIEITRNKYVVEKNKEKTLLNEETILKENFVKLEEKEIELQKKLKENTVSFDKMEVINVGVNLENEIVNIEPKILKINQLVQKNEADEKDLLEKLQKQNEKFEKISRVVKEQLENKKNYFSTMLKKELKVGDICPVCNEEIKSLSHIDGDIKGFDESVDEELKTLELEIHKLKASLEIVQAEKNKNSLELKSENENRQTLIEKLEKLKAENNIENFKNEKKSIEEKSKLLEKISEEIKSIIHEKKINSELREEKNKTLNEVIKAITSYGEQGKSLKAKIDIVNRKIDEFTNGKNLEEIATELGKNKDYFVSTENNLRLEKENLEKTKNKLVIDKNSAELNIKNSTELIKNNSENIRNDIEKFGFVDESDVKAYFVNEDEIEKYKKKIQEFKDHELLVKNNISKISIELSMLESEFETIDRNEFRDNLGKKDNELLELTKQIEEIAKTITSEETKLEITKKNLEKVSELKSELKELTKKSDNLNEIVDLLKGRRFVQFIAKRYLDNICRTASIKLYEMSGKKYSLEADEVDFVVVDHNRGNIKRQIKSISGGELFMVSLCLSLSLSTYISKQNSGSIDMFFLDEGFGSLDDETLENVVDILFKASSTDLKIGLITHVTKLQENLPSKLYVREDIEKQSSMITLQ